MLDAAREGQLRALWTFGYDVYLTNPNSETTRRALERMELVVVQDLFLNETARAFGHVFLPCAASYERDGTFMNGERRVNRVRKAVDAPGEALPDWEILCRVAAAMGRGDLFPYPDAESIWNEVRQVWQAGAGISYDRLDAGGLQWPCPAEDHPGTIRLHGETFPVGRRAGLRPVPYEPTPEQTDEDFPFLLNSGRTLYQFNAGTMTMRTPNVRLRPTDTLDLAPEDADRLGLADGDLARLRTRHGEAVLPVRVTTSVKRGELFTTFHDPKAFVNRALGPHRDKYAMTPEYKVTAARVERA
jgi:formate dehydrogenase major subunit